MRKGLLILVVLSIWPAWLYAALGTISGENEEVWKDANLSVIVAVVKKTWRLEGDYRNGTDGAILLPKATIAGNFDPSLHSQINVHFWTGNFGTSIGNPPPEGAMILTVIARPGSYERPKQYIILPDICSFMPRNLWNNHASSSIAIIKGLDDPQVAQTLKRIQQVRLKGKAATRPATRPTTTPGIDK